MRMAPRLGRTRRGSGGSHGGGRSTRRKEQTMSFFTERVEPRSLAPSVNAQSQADLVSRTWRGRKAREPYSLGKVALCQTKRRGCEDHRALCVSERERVLMIGEESTSRLGLVSKRIQQSIERNGCPHKRKIASPGERGDVLVSGGQKCQDVSGALGNGLLEWVEQRQRLETRCPKRAGSRCCRLTVRC